MKLRPNSEGAGVFFVEAKAVDGEGAGDGHEGAEGHKAGSDVDCDKPER